ncbi:MAG: hypothetical protein IKH12_06185, partial [Clostridia bacterium]|nr:hypothetical protein [Clostridia bacterium]
SQVEELQAGQDIQPTADEWDVPCYNDLPCSFVSENGEYVITITSIEAHCKKMRSSRISVQKSERNKKKILKKSIGSSKIVVADTTKKEWHLCSILMISKLNLKVKAFDAVTLESARKETKP